MSNFMACIALNFILISRSQKKSDHKTHAGNLAMFLCRSESFPTWCMRVLNFSMNIVCRSRKLQQMWVCQRLDFLHCFSGKLLLLRGILSWTFTWIHTGFLKLISEPKDTISLVDSEWSSLVKEWEERMKGLFPPSLCNIHTCKFSIWQKLLLLGKC